MIAVGRASLLALVCGVLGAACGRGSGGSAGDDGASPGEAGTAAADAGHAGGGGAAGLGGARPGGASGSGEGGESSCEPCEVPAPRCTTDGDREVAAFAGCDGPTCTFDWTAVACALPCVDGHCGGCEDECALGSATCVDGVLGVCGSDAAGCLVQQREACASGACADASRCQVCTELCELGTTRCVDAALSTCVADGACTTWSAPQACSSGSCDTSTACAGGDPGAGICSEDGWCWVAPLPHGHALYAVDRADGHLWAVGEGGVIIHQLPDGSFETTHWPGRPFLYAVEAVSGEDVWAVGDGGLILHYASGAWSSVPSGTSSPLRALFAFGPDDVWTGGGSVYTGTAVLHHDGNGWSPVTATGAGFWLTSFIYGRSPTDLYVGGGGDPAPHIVHSDGSAWSYVTDLTLRLEHLGLTDMTEFAGDLYVGTNLYDGEIWRLREGAWTPLATDRGADTGRQPIYSLAANDEALWLAGHWDLVRYDGSTFTRAHGTRTAGGRHGVHADADGVWLGAQGGRLYQGGSAGFELSYGMEWAGIGDSGWVVAADDEIWWMGERRVRYDGTTWQEIDAPYPITAVHEAAQLWFASNQEVYRETDSGWELVTTAPRVLTSLWVSPSGQLFGGNSEALLRFDGSSWSEYGIPSALYGDISAIDGWSDDLVWAVGSRTAVRWDGAVWHNEWRAEFESDWLTTVDVLAPDSVWMAGADTRVYHYDGSSITLHDPDMPMWILSLVAFDDQDVWVVGSENNLPGVVSHFDGTSWSRQTTGCGRPLDSLHVRDENTLYVSGPGALLRWERPGATD